MSEPALSTNMRSRDNEFYMIFTTFEVQGVLFRVPVEAFETRSKFFCEMFSLPVGDGLSTAGSSDHSPIVLERVEAEDFKALLRFLDPKERGEMAVFSKKEWLGIYALSYMWGFEDAKDASEAFLLAQDVSNPASPQTEHSTEKIKFVSLVVPQTRYRSYTSSDPRRYVDEIQLQPPIEFYTSSPNGKIPGIPLRDAIMSKFMRLIDRDESLFQGCGPSHSGKILL